MIKKKKQKKKKQKQVIQSTHNVRGEKTQPQCRYNDIDVESTQKQETTPPRRRVPTKESRP